MHVDVGKRGVAHKSRSLSRERVTRKPHPPNPLKKILYIEGNMVTFVVERAVARSEDEILYT